ASWGSTTTWPSALSDTQASYVITTPGSLSGAMTDRGVQRLGDLDGDGYDDFAIGYSAANSNLGAVIVVKGGPSFSSRTPDATNSFQVNGTMAGGLFGAAVIGMGKFYRAAPGTTMIATASVAGTSYAFVGGAGPSGVVAAASAHDSTAGSAAGRYRMAIGFPGPPGGSPGAFTLGATTGKYVDLDLGTEATGPFLGTPGGAPAASVRFTDPASASSFGVINIGSGDLGTPNAVSLIGADALPDLVLAGQGEPNNPIYLVSGSVLTTLSGTVDVTKPLAGNVPGIIRVPSKLPADWGNGYATGCVILDLDGDQFGDFAIGELAPAAPGRVAVFY